MIRTYKNFGSYTPIGVYNQLGLVIDGCDGNPNFPTLPVSVADMKTQQTALDTAILDAQTGGPESKATRDNVVEQTIVMLRKNASYVDIHCNDDMAVLLSSGFQPVSTNRAQSPVDAPIILSVEYGNSGELRPRVKAQSNAKSYVGRIKEANGSEFGPNITFASSRAILFDGLKAGVTYVMQLCAIGGSNGQSDWSEPASKMAM
ncbi:MAG: fibronectin type III domain-containing protein [Chthoniobacterales bacterium]